MSPEHSIGKSLNWVIITFLLACLAGTPKPASAVSYKFASPTGTPADACTYTDPCNLQTAVNTSSPGGLVYIAAGTYHPYSLPSDQVLLITQSVHIYGGWDGVSGGDPGIPDYESYVSTLDGENARQVVTILLDAGETVTLTGLSIRNGNGTGKIGVCSAVAAAGCGGGVFISGGTTTIENCIIEDNVASTTTAATYQTGYGGGIYVQVASAPNPTAVTIEHNIIRSNDASTATSGPVGDNGLGGGIFIGGVLAPEDLLITGNDISFNSAASAAYSGLGDGLLIYGVYGTVSDNDIHDNNPSLRTQGSTLFATHSDLTIAGNQFINNHGSHCLYLLDFNGYLDSNTIINPDCWNGIFLEMNEVPRLSTLINNIIARHSTSDVYISGYSDKIARVNLYHNTLDGALYGIYAYQFSTINMNNSILSHHLSKGIHKAASGNTVNLAYTLFHGNTVDGDMDLVAFPLTGDPYFVNAPAGDYRLQAISAARDRANSIGYAYDFEGDPRPMGSGGTPYDVGADEFWWKFYLPILQKP